jgi:hypothetical protein
MLKHRNATATEHLDASLLSLLMLRQKGYRGRRRAFNGKAPPIP